MTESLKTFHACRNGSTAVEYSLIAAIISICMVMTANHIGTEAKEMYEYIITSIKASEAE